MGDVTGISGSLTDGTGVSSLTGTKILKDLVLDALLSVPVALVAINVASLEMAAAAPAAVAYAVGNALIRVVYRAALRWAQS